MDSQNIEIVVYVSCISNPLCFQIVDLAQFAGAPIRAAENITGGETE